MTQAICDITTDEVNVDVVVEPQANTMVEVANRAGGMEQVFHDNTLIGNGNSVDLGVNTDIIATKEYSDEQDTLLRNEINGKLTAIDSQIDANADAIQKTREDYINADSEIHQILNNHASELTTLRGNQASLGDQVSGIEQKIPESASGSNPLITKQQLLDEEMDIRDDLNEGLSELQTQITAQAAEIATKQDQLIAGDNITIVDNVISATGGGGGGGIANVVHDTTLTGSGTTASPLGVAKNLSVEELTVGTDEGTLNLSITAGTATIATNNGLDIVAQTKFDRAPTTDDTTAWADANPTALVTKQQVVSAISEGGGASGDYLPLSGGTLTGQVSIDIGETSGYTWTDYPVLLMSWTNPDAWADYTDTGFYATANGLAFGKKSVGVPVITLDPSNKKVLPGTTYTEAFDSGIDIGSSYNKFRSIAVAKIATGQNSETFEDTFIEIPNSKVGTIATIEDMATIGGEGTTGQVLTKTDDGLAWQEPAGGGTKVIFREWE